MRGESAIVQLPTGVGKTKSIELIIRAAFMENRATSAIIIAPLRALCNEIANDMIVAFGDNVLVNQFSDILENDFSLGQLSSIKSTIWICTPEKFNYIIHHQSDVINEIGLYIFDESHMFDDGNRGASYELLMAEIREQVFLNQQIVLLSAVLSNANQIKEWLLRDKGVLASDVRIKATPKTIGFISHTRDIHYYSDDPVNEDFFVPRSITVTALQKIGKETKLRYFPELTDSKDIAIYYASKLCENGGVAVFANRTKTVQTVIKRINELVQRGYDLSGIKVKSDENELNKLSLLIADYYGQQHPYTLSCKYGVVPHYSNLPNGIRIAIEHAFRTKSLCFVVCTSTLSQGVNIPIRYLFMTSFKVSKNSMQIRSFQNLMGRTARSGMYTEGSVIVTDSKFYDEKNDRRHGGNYRWRDCIRMFDSNAAEPCGSSILMLVQNLDIDYETHISGNGIANFIIQNYDKQNCFELLIAEVTNALHNRYPQKAASNITPAVMNRKNTIAAIENHLCHIFSGDDTLDRQESAITICKGTLAYFMANDSEQVLLEKIFTVIAAKVNKLSNSQTKNYARAMVGVDLSVLIDNWIRESKLTECFYSDEQLVDLLISFFKSTHTVKKAFDSFEKICTIWMNGWSFYRMSEDIKMPIADIEEVCSKSISYELSFFVGNIIDIIELDEDDVVNPVPSLALIQKKFKYGVKKRNSRINL